MRFQKAIIQIPCFNEEKTLALTLSHLPRKLSGFKKVEWMLIDDGSTDNSVAVAKAMGVDHVVSLGGHQGLATAYLTGLQKACEFGADVVINTDGDNQYAGADVAKLVEPLVAGTADFVLGSRKNSKLSRLPSYKKNLYWLAAHIVSFVTQRSITDPTSGFRAVTRQVAQTLPVTSRYTYTLETLIYAAYSGLRIQCLDIQTNPVTRPSRLIRSIPEYIVRSAWILSRSVCLYAPILVQRKWLAPKENAVLRIPQVPGLALENTVPAQ